MLYYIVPDGALKNDEFTKEGEYVAFTFVTRDMEALIYFQRITSYLHPEIASKITKLATSNIESINWTADECNSIYQAFSSVGGSITLPLRDDDRDSLQRFLMVMRYCSTNKLNAVSVVFESPPEYFPSPREDLP